MRRRLGALLLTAVLAGCGARSETVAPIESSGAEAEGAETDTNPDAGSGVVTGADADTGAEVDSGTDAAPGAGTDADAVAGTGTTAGTVTAAGTVTGTEQPANATMRAQLEILERQTRELEQVAAQIAAARERVRVGPSGVPPVCEDRAAIEALRIVGTSGSAGASAAISAVGALEDHCEPFEEWMHPEERTARRIQDYLQQLERIAGWLRDIRRCESTTGAERARCENAYSDVQREAAEEAGRALVLLEEHQRELGPVRTGAARFPCTTPALTRIAAVAWVGSVARAQMGALSRAAMTVCDTIGVADADVRESERRVVSSLDHAESSARAQRRNHLEAMESLRPYAQ